MMPRRTCVRSLRRIVSPRRTSGATYCPLADVQGTIWGYVDANNSIVARFEYDAWGNILSSTSSVPALAVNRYRFQCREWSAATGLVNFRARWYDPVTGRWLSKDPIGLNGGLNLYAFCGNDPVNLSDFFGLCTPKKNPTIITPSGKKIPYPPGVDIKENIRIAEEKSIIWDAFWFKNQVRNHGPWDYKQRGKQYEDFGNFHFGVVGRAFGFPSNILLREAGRAQMEAGTSRPGWGEPGPRFWPFGGSGSFGDDPADQDMINEGIVFYDGHFYDRMNVQMGGLTLILH